MSKRRTCILGTGSHVPEKVLTNDDLARIVETSDEWIITRTGIRRRHIAAENEATSDVASPAALRACEAAGAAPSDIDALILGTATPDMLFPSTACIVQANIGAVNAAAFDISAACSGFIYGMALGKALIETGQAGRVLVIGAETLTKIVNWEDRNTCVLFGDGAGAAVLGRSEGERGILSINFGSDGRLWELLHQPAGGSRMPATIESVEGKKHKIHMTGRDVFKHAVNHMSGAGLKALADAGHKGPELDMLFPHQANIRIMEAVAKRLEVPREKVYVNLERFGNTSAASIPIALDEAIRNGQCKPGMLIGLVAFGGGFTWAASVVRV
ncbi:MAG: beta-ketoacyl-ACP synthase III [Candidatus Eisenbacteria bacterium]